MNMVSTELFNTISYLIKDMSLNYVLNISAQLQDEWNMRYDENDIMYVHSNLYGGVPVKIDKILFSKQTKYNRLELTVRIDNVYMIFQHKLSIDYLKSGRSDAEIAILNFNSENLDKLKPYIERLESDK